MDNGQPIFPTGMNSQSFQSSPLVSATDGGSPVVVKDKKQRWSIIIAAVVFLVAMIAVAIWAIASKSSRSETDSITTDREVYVLMRDSYEEITNIQQTFIDLRDGYYSSTDLFSEANHAYINGMGEKMQSFYQSITNIDASKITVPLAQSKFEELKINLSQNISLYMDTVDLYNIYYESRDTGSDTSDTIVTDIFGAYTNTEDFTSVYYYRIMGDLIAELQNYENE